MMNDKDMRNDLKQNSYIKSETVCSHLHKKYQQNIKTKETAYPFIIDFYDGLYFVYWYCYECIKNYRLFESGVLIYDHDTSDEAKLTIISGFVAGDDPDKPPFSDFLEHETKDFVSRPDFFLMCSIKNDSEIIDSYPDILRVPFGLVRCR